MTRNPPNHIVMPRRRVSERAAGQFFHLTHVISSVFVPTDTEVEALDQAYLSIGNFLADSPEFSALTIEVYGHGSRQTGTLVRPLHVRNLGFDVDAVLLLKRAALQLYASSEGARRLINDLYAVLKRYADQHGLKIEKWERCVTLVYANDVRVDVAPVIEDPQMIIPSGETHALIPDRLLRRYAPTNPRGLERGFNSAAKIQANFPRQLVEGMTLDMAMRGEVAPLPDVEVVSARLLSIFVQLMKVHRNISFGAPRDGVADLSPTSIFITSLAAGGYTLEAPLPHDTPLDLLLDVLQAMPQCFEREELTNGEQRWSLPNPCAPGDDLATSMNSPQRQAAFLRWHDLFAEQIGQLLDSLEQRAGDDVIEKLVHNAFGPHAARAVRDDAAPVAPTRQAGRPVIFATAAGAMPSVTARANTNYGSPD